MTNIAVPVSQALDETMLGASEAAAALGLNKYQSPMDVWRRKVAARRGDPMPPREENEPMAWGKALEPIIRGKYALMTGRHVIVPTESSTAGDLTRSRYDGDSTAHWLRATVDGFVVPESHRMSTTGGELHDLVVEVNGPGTAVLLAGDGLLEVKTAGAWAADQWENGVPEVYEIQVRVQMAVTDLPWCDVVCLIGGQRFVGPFRIERDHDKELAILADLRAFWQLVLDETPPQVDNSEAWSSYASSKMRKTAVTIPADIEISAFLCEWQQARTERKRAEAQEREIKTQLLLRLSAAGATAIDGGDLGKVTAYQPGARMDWKGYAESLEKALRAAPATRIVTGNSTLTLGIDRDAYVGEPGEWTIRAPYAWGK